MTEPQRKRLARYRTAESQVQLRQPPKTSTRAPTEIRELLLWAQWETVDVELFLSGDPTQGRPIETLCGRIEGLMVTADGRARVVVGISEDAQRVVPLDRITRARSVTA